MPRTWCCHLRRRTGVRMSTTDAAWQRTAERIRSQNIERLATDMCDAFYKSPIDLPNAIKAMSAALAAGPQPADELAQRLERYESLLQKTRWCIERIHYKPYPHFSYDPVVRLL